MAINHLPMVKLAAIERYLRIVTLPNRAYRSAGSQSLSVCTFGSNFGAVPR